MAEKSGKKSADSAGEADTALAKHEPASDLAVPAAPPEIDAAKLDKVLHWIVSGATERQIQSLAQQAWPGADTTPLIVAAMTSVAETGEADPTIVKGWCIEATRAIYRRALEAKDLELALRAVQQLHRIAGSNK